MKDWRGEPKRWYSMSACGCVHTSSNHPWVVRGTSLSGEFVHVCDKHSPKPAEVVPQQPAEAVADIETAARELLAAEYERAGFAMDAKFILTEPATSNPQAIALRAIAAALRTAPPAIDIGKLRELVSEWRSEARDIRDRGMACNYNSIFARADQLAALIGYKG